MSTRRAPSPHTHPPPGRRQSRPAMARTGWRWRNRATRRTRALAAAWTTGGTLSLRPGPDRAKAAFYASASELRYTPSRHHRTAAKGTLIRGTDQGTVVAARVFGQVEALVEAGEGGRRPPVALAEQAHDG